MHPFPHTYESTAQGQQSGSIMISSDRLHEISTNTPEQFGGPGDQWSPETMLMASMADCFVLSFRSIAAASKFDWTTLACVTTGVLDRVDGITRFTSMTNHVILTAPAGTPEDKARRLLEKAEGVCLIGNSLNAERHLEIELRFAA